MKLMENHIINWLIEEDNPMVKYRTLNDICGYETDDALNKLYESIWNHRNIVRIIKKQEESGLWKDDYGSALFSAMRYLTMLAEYGLKCDPRIDRYVEHVIRVLESQDDIGGCTVPLVLRALVMLGYHTNPAVANLINAFSSTQLSDGGFMCKRLLDKKPERKSCYKATLAGLLLYSECKSKSILPQNSDKLIEYFIKRDVFYSSDKQHSFKEGRFGWRFIDNFFPVEPMRMGLPLIVCALSNLGVGCHPALSESWVLLNEKKDYTGRLLLEGTLSKQPCSFGKINEPNKWVTFYAVLAEKHRHSFI